MLNVTFLLLINLKRSASVKCSYATDSVNANTAIQNNLMKCDYIKHFFYCKLHRNAF